MSREKYAGIKILLEKRLSDDYTLSLQEWESDLIVPGKFCYNLRIERGNLMMQFPTIGVQNYTRNQIERMYISINSLEDFRKLNLNFSN